MPRCRSTFDINQVDFETPFRSPVCDEYIYVPRRYLIFSACRSLLISGTLCFALGARGTTLVLLTLLAWLPIGFVILFWTRHFAPPKLKPCSPPHSEVLGLHR